MPRNMSFFLTQQQIKNRSKDVTRRFGWAFLKPGEILNAVEKAQGLGKGGKINVFCQIQVVSTRWEPLNSITQEDVIREGFPDFNPIDFVEMLCSHYKCEPTKLVNRIEFKYLVE